jgi:hypothetical protein
LWQVPFVKNTNPFLSVFLALALIFLQASFAMAQTLPADTTTDTTPPATEEMAPPAAPVGPSISSISVTNITDTSAEIDVNSDEMVQGYVEYGTTEQYGASTPLSSEFTTSPSFLLENLMPETLYHYRVVVVDSAGTAAITGDETFTTLATPAPEPELEQLPVTETATTTATSTATTATTTPAAPALAISNTETTYVSTSTVMISWQTNKDADSQIEYGTTNAYGLLTPIGAISQSHMVALSSLTPNTKYYYRAISKTFGETAYSPAESFTTLKAQAAPTYPVISNVSTTITSTSTTISWTTSEPATSDIAYGTTTSYGSTVGKDDTLQTSHTRTFANPTPSGTYHFRIVSADSNGNTSFGKDRTFSIEPSVSSGSATTEPIISEPTASSSAEILANIAEQGAQAAAAQGGGGLPVVHSHPLLLNVTPLDREVSFNWLKDTGVQNGIIHTVIVRKEGTDPVLSRIDGDIIYDGPSTTFTDTNVQNGVEYHYALYSYDVYGRFTTASRFKVVPQAGEEQIDIPAAEAVVTTPLVLFRDLYQGTQGDDVSVLQAHLAGHGYYPEALVTGYFGPLTEAAIVRYQQLNAISPAVGYAGPITRGVLGQ